VAEGGGFLARDAPLGEQAKDLSESAVNSRRGSEVAAGGMELGKVEYGADDVTSGCRVAEQLFFSFSVKAAAGGMDFGARHAALAAIGERELATIGQDIFIDDRIIVCGGRLNVTCRRCGGGAVVDLVRREIGAICFRGILEGTRMRKNAVAFEWFLYGRHMLCYHNSI